MSDRIVVQPGEVINRETGQVAPFQSLPISPTEKVTPDDPRWTEAVKNNCGDKSHTFTKQQDGTYQKEVG